MNPVLRQDLRYRLGSPKALTIHTIFLLVVAGLTYLSLPDLGRLDTLRQEGLLLACLLITTLLAMYFASSFACGEIAIEGEKSVWDLAASSLPAGIIARGKVLSSAALAVVQLLLASPFLAVVAGIRGEPPMLILQAALVAVPASTAAGAAGALYSVRLDSDFTRSFAHWMTLLAMVVGANALPVPWNALSPVQALAITLRQGSIFPVWVVAAAYLGVTVACVLAISRRVDAIRRETPVASAG